MNARQRVENVLMGLLMILCSVIMVLYPEGGYLFVVLLVSLSLLLSGLRSIVYYFSMARHMVGGRWILYTGVIVFDLGMFTFAVADSPRALVLLYLLGFFAFAGLVDILRGLEARRLEAPSWKFNTAHGAVNILIAVFCIVFVRSTRVLVDIYCLSMFFSACARIASAFRRTKMVYIQ